MKLSYLCKLLRKSTKKGMKMTIQDKIALDEMAVMNAQQSLDSAKAQLATDQESLANIAPVLDLVAQLEAKITDPSITELLEQVKDLVSA